MIVSRFLRWSSISCIKKLFALGIALSLRKYWRLVTGYDDNYWNGIRQIVAYQGLLEKFRQNTELKDKLLSTGSSTLAECAVKDRIWGIGLSMKNPDRFEKAKWKGQNLLGYTLMKVRDSL